jgi:hypothetical protein
MKGDQDMGRKVFFITLIFIVTSIAWIILGGTMQGRTYGQHAKLSARVEGLWGSAHIQTAPNVTYRTIVPRKAERVTEDEKGHKLRKTEIINETVINKVNLDSSDIRVDLDLTHRQKGLLWYSTYRVGFHAVYTVTNPRSRPERFLMSFSFPSKDALYDNFVLTVDGKAVDIKDFTLGEVAVPFPLEPKGTATIEIGYTSQGLDKWFYKFGEGVNRVKNFSLAMKTNFKDIDFPQDTVSPTEKTPLDSGWDLLWKSKDLISGFQIGMDMPNKLNPGPLASQISFFAPVSLLFFFFVILMITTIKDINIHPMNFVFLAASFFAFHLLFSYTVDHLHIVPAFLLSAIVSMFLVISYMRIVVGARLATVEIGISQFIFLVLFSLAHFFEGYTGLTVTIGAIITLWAMMQLTARIDWEEKFRTAKSQPVQGKM